MQKAGVSLSSLPPPPRSENPDYITCPHCDRRFNQQAGERHIAACKNTINKPKAVGVGRKPPAAGSMAAQREAQAARQHQAAAPSRGGGPVRAMPTANGYGAGAYGGGGDEYGSYGQPQQLSPPSHARPGSSGGMQPRGVVGRPPAMGGGAGPVPAAAKRSPSPAAASRASPPGGAGVGRQPSYGGSSVPGRHSGGGAGDPDLHAKINQLTETVQMLSKAVLSPTGAGAGSARGIPARAPSPAGRRPGAGAGGGGSSCRSCGQLNPVASAKFCPHCGSRS